MIVCEVNLRCKISAQMDRFVCSVAALFVAAGTCSLTHPLSSSGTFGLLPPACGDMMR